MDDFGFACAKCASTNGRKPFSRNACKAHGCRPSTGGRKTYSPEYIKVQVETARAKGGIGFLFWNAANDYSKPFIAMPEMKVESYKDATNKERSKDNPRCLRAGDEPAAPVVQASATTEN